MLDSGDLDFSFSGLKTAVLTLVRRLAGPGGDPAGLDHALRADVAAEFESAVVEVLAAKAMAALDRTGHARLVVAGGVGANRRLRQRLADLAARRGAAVYVPDPVYCTDNGAMIAQAGALRLAEGVTDDDAFSVRPRWPLETLEPPRGSATRVPA
jgi:N6-L-threonylcarbamoyladenine synthase